MASRRPGITPSTRHCDRSHLHAIDATCFGHGRIQFVERLELLLQIISEQRREAGLQGLCRVAQLLGPLAQRLLSIVPERVELIIGQRVDVADLFFR